MSRLLQVPQYVVLTAAEVMFSVTGLGFAYSQVSGLPLHMYLEQSNWNKMVSTISSHDGSNKPAFSFFMTDGEFLV